jgi:hypothetical protein
MDSYRQVFVQTIRVPRSAILKPSTPEETTTHRRWAFTVLAFYCVLFTCTGVAILAISSMTDPDRQVARASSQKNLQTEAGR